MATHWMDEIALGRFHFDAHSFFCIITVHPAQANLTHAHVCTPDSSPPSKQKRGGLCKKKKKYLQTQREH